MSGPKFDPNMPSHVRDICEELLDQGLELDDLNQGCSVIDYASPEPNSHLLYQGGDIQACECLQTAINRFESDPDNWTHRLAVEDYIGYSIPWAIDSPELAFEVEAARNELDRIITEQDHKPGSRTYREMLAVGLFYFTLFPKDPNQVLENMDRYPDFTRELCLYDLGEFEDYLYQFGGLGAVNLEGNDCETEQSAEIALELDCGWCTEHSKLLYGVFDLAGLDPFFAALSNQAVKENFGLFGIELPEAVKNLGHIFIGISFDHDDVMYFDPTNRICNPPYRNVKHLETMQALADDMNQVYRSSVSTEELPHDIEMLERAKTLDPNSAMVMANLGMKLIAAERYEEAIVELEQAIAIDPEFFDNPFILYKLGIAYIKAERYLEAIPHLKRSYDLDMMNKDCLAGLVQAHRELGKTAEALFYLDGFNMFDRFARLRLQATQLDNPAYKIPFEEELNKIGLEFKDKPSRFFAIKYLLQLNLEHPTSVGYNVLGFLFLQQKQMELSAEAFRMSIQFAVEENQGGHLHTAYKNLQTPLKWLIMNNLSNPVFERIIEEDSPGAKYARGALIVTFQSVVRELQNKGITNLSPKGKDIFDRANAKGAQTVSLTSEEK